MIRKNEQADRETRPVDRGVFRKTLSRMTNVQTVRFAAVGLVNTGIDFATFFLLWGLYPPGHDLWLAGAYSIAGWATGSVTSYFLHSRVTFRSELPAAGFYAVAVLGVAVQTGATSVAAKLFGSEGAAVGKIGGILLGSSLTYLGYRWLAARSAKMKARIPGTLEPSLEPWSH